MYGTDWHLVLSVFFLLKIFGFLSRIISLYKIASRSDSPLITLVPFRNLRWVDNREIKIRFDRAHQTIESNEFSIQLCWKKISIFKTNKCEMLALTMKVVCIQEIQLSFRLETRFIIRTIIYTRSGAIRKLVNVRCMKWIETLPILKRMTCGCPRYWLFLTTCSMSIIATCNISYECYD